MVGLTGPIGVHVKEVVAQPSKLENGTVAIQYQLMVEIALVQKKILRNVTYLHATVSLILAIHCEKSDLIRGFSGSYFSAFSSNVGQYGVESVRILTLFMQ